MTAEIAVINKSAVALAADSAVTISDGNGSQSKVYNGAEKLFALTKYHPVGIMVYGAGTLCRMPWEVVIKQYRKKLGSECFENLELYTEDFLSFVQDDEHLVTQDLRDSFIREHWHAVIETLWRLTISVGNTKIDETGIQPTKDETYEIIVDICSKIRSKLEEEQYLEGFTQDDFREVQEECKDFVDSNSEDLHKAVPEEKVEELKDNFREIVALATVKNNDLGPNSGVVFAGYGDKECFPSVLAFNLKGFWKNKLRYCPLKHKSAPAGKSDLMAYAQDEEVNTFVQGISPRLKEKVDETVVRIVGQTLEHVKSGLEMTGLSEADRQELEKNIEGLVTNTLATEVGEFSQFIEMNFTQQVVNMVEFLPKDELAYMAESLVNMTAFKRKVTSQSESVGGPIDVAIISKGDGFVWIKRKHYFDKELNNHYFDNFLRKEKV